MLLTTMSELALRTRVGFVKSRLDSASPPPLREDVTARVR
jgi:hypothetical protein